MDKRFAHIINAVYCDPWIIRPQMYSVICDIVNQHYTGHAHIADGCANTFVIDGKEEDDKILDIVDNVAVININGVISKGVSALEKMSGLVDVDEISDAIDEAVEDETIEGMLLNIDSPGGTVQGVPELADKIRAARSVMPIVAFTDSMAASAAYWLASQAWAIVATPSSVVGSIGVYNAVLDQSKAYEKAGFNQTVIKAGTFKGMGIPGTSLTDEQLSFMQSRVDYIFDLFKTAVVSGRGRKIDDSDMQGQDFFGSQALGNGLIDAVGDINDAMMLIKSKGKEMRR